MLALLSGQPLEQFTKSEYNFAPTGIANCSADAAPLARDAQGYLWFGTDTALTRWKDGAAAVKFVSGLKPAEGLDGVDAICAGADESMWVGMSRGGTGLGLQHVTGATWKPIVVPGFDSSTLTVTALHVDVDGSLWIGTLDQGLYRFHAGKVEHFGAADGLSSDNISQISEDKEGDLWVMTAEGLDRFRVMPVTTLTKRQGLTTVSAVSVFAARDGALWIANDGAINILRDGRISSLGPRQGLPGKEVVSVFEDHLREIWIGVDNKLVVYDKGAFRTLNLPDGKPFGLVDSITEDMEGTIWVATQQRGFELYRVRDFKVKLEPGLPDPYTASPNQNGGLWLGLLNGDIASYKDGKLVRYAEPHVKKGYSPPREISVTPDGSVFAASNHGLIQMRNGVSKVLTESNGLPCGMVISYLRDQEQNIYINLECGIVSITSAEMERWWNHPETSIKF